MGGLVGGGAGRMQAAICPVKASLAGCRSPFLGRRVGGMGLNIPGLWDMGVSMGQAVEGKSCQGRAGAAFQARLP